jgi:hypothetical protein
MGTCVAIRERSFRVPRDSKCGTGELLGNSSQGEDIPVTIFELRACPGFPEIDTGP